MQVVVGTLASLDDRILWRFLLCIEIGRPLMANTDTVTAVIIRFIYCI